MYDKAYKTDGLNADLVLSLLAFNRCDNVCITLTQLRTIFVLTLLTLERYNEKTVGEDKRLNLFGRCLPVESA